ncbi:hypothetical protein WR25_22751 [Diploscapter pachys]|uniref:DNA-directed RNA polymerase RBP11-like dimerisation domain-containing protein n=1 Tax=Diploscapter pachys TaxID=2018661 RepID=A0A2A2LKN5_9BILA|nr:hypothetical protein WR25_22751 [Diploscapter pachys]
MTAAKQKIEFLDLKTPDVEFCGYSVPHPLEDKILFRVQTHRQKDALQVILKGLDELEQVFAVIQDKFEEKKAAHGESSA